jgi:CheY-like chemotaxis protein
MTSDMAFECLMVSQDQAVIGMMSDLLDDLSISTNVCASPADAPTLMAGKSTDLLVVDLLENAPSDFMRKIRCGRTQRTTVMAISGDDSQILNAHLVLRKPLRTDAASRYLKVAYSRMLQDHRKRARFSVMKSLLAVDQDKRSVPLTITDIGHGGAGIVSKMDLAIDDVLNFALKLPDAQGDLNLNLRILWTREYGAAGGEFLQMAPTDIDVLNEWIERKGKVKKPRIQM